MEALCRLRRTTFRLGPSQIATNMRGSVEMLFHVWIVLAQLNNLQFVTNPRHLEREAVALEKTHFTAPGTKFHLRLDRAVFSQPTLRTTVFSCGLCGRYFHGKNFL